MILFTPSVSSAPQVMNSFPTQSENLTLVRGFVMGTRGEGWECCLGGLLRDSPLTGRCFNSWFWFHLSFCSPSLDALPIRVTGGLTRQMIKTLVIRGNQNSPWAFKNKHLHLFIDYYVKKWGMQLLGHWILPLLLPHIFFLLVSIML